MEIISVEERENPFFKRNEVKLKLKHEGISTPSKTELIKELAGKYKVDESQVLIDYIFSEKGIGESFAKVKILEEKPVVVTPKEEKVEGEGKIEAPASETQ
jgi:ribosomal protein S24E